MTDGFLEANLIQAKQAHVPGRKRTSRGGHSLAQSSANEAIKKQHQKRSLKGFLPVS